jgi:putative DNA primase/helicase
MSAADDDKVVPLRLTGREVPHPQEDGAATQEILSQLQRGDRGPLANLSNLVVLLRLDPVLSRLCAHDEFTGVNVLRAPPPPVAGGDPPPGPYPRQQRPTDVSMIRAYVQRTWIARAGKDDMDDAIDVVARSRRFHPPRDWLASLAWDGRPRLDLWMIHTFGAPDTPYVRAVARCFLIAAVRRIRSPGCKFDHILVLQGPQDLGKSTVCRVLFTEPWFSDSLPAQLEGRDAAIGLRGVWGVEFAELEQIIRTENDIIKAFLSRPVDRYKPMYGRDFIEQPRQCVFIGTTNSDDWLRDATGNRRYWPILCARADVEWLRLCHAQLWAEAAHHEAAGESHWLQEAPIIAQARAEQADRMQDDIWTDRIRHIVAYRTTTTTAEILGTDMEIPLERQTRREQMRVNYIMKSLGWSQEFVSNVKDGKAIRGRRWRSPQNSDN